MLWHVPIAGSVWVRFQATLQWTVASGEERGEEMWTEELTCPPIFTPLPAFRFLSRRRSQLHAHVPRASSQQRVHAQTVVPVSWCDQLDRRVELQHVKTQRTCSLGSVAWW